MAFLGANSIGEFFNTSGLKGMGSSLSKAWKYRGDVSVNAYGVGQSGNLGMSNLKQAGRDSWKWLTASDRAISGLARNATDWNRYGIAGARIGSTVLGANLAINGINTLSGRNRY